MSEWQPISTARKDRTVYWAAIRRDLVEHTKRETDRMWAGIQVPIRHPGLCEDGFDLGWNIAAPVGHGGMPDDWFAGVMVQPPLPETILK